MKDVMEKIPGSFRKMMAKEVKQSLCSNCYLCYIGEDDDDGKDGGRIQS